MFINLQELELRSVRFKVDIPAGEIDFDSKITQSSVLHAEGVAELINHSLGEIRVQGDLEVSTEAPCDRCLEAVSLPIRNHFDLVYMPSSSIVEGGEDEIDEAWPSRSAITKVMACP